jgi:hypothetical protein
MEIGRLTFSKSGDHEGILFPPKLPGCSGQPLCIDMRSDVAEASDADPHRRRRTTGPRCLDEGSGDA